MPYKCLACESVLFKGAVDGWWNCLQCGFEYSQMILTEAGTKPDHLSDLEDLHAPVRPMLATQREVTHKTRLGADHTTEVQDGLILRVPALSGTKRHRS